MVYNNTIMATEKQKIALDKIVENRGNIGKAMIEAGYDPTTAKNPKNLTTSKGFIQLCEERGLTDDFLLDALVEDIEKKPGNRKAELELGFKVRGRTQSEESKGDVNVQINLINYGDNDTTPIQA